MSGSGHNSASPRFSIVVPSFNQAPFLGDCLDALREYHPNYCEVIVMDGGSNDGSAQIIAANAHRLSYWQSRPDGGQAAALKEGFNRATGQILGWLNSDDRLLPNALYIVDEFFRANPEVQWAYGDLYTIDECGQQIRRLYRRQVGFQEIVWSRRYLPQASTFFLKSAYRQTEGVDPNLHLAMDYDLWLKLGALKAPGKVHKLIGEFRVHGNQKSHDYVAYENEAKAVRERFAQCPPSPSQLKKATWSVFHRLYSYSRMLEDISKILSQSGSRLASLAVRCVSELLR